MKLTIKFIDNDLCPFNFPISFASIAQRLNDIVQFCLENEFIKSDYSRCHDSPFSWNLPTCCILTAFYQSLQSPGPAVPLASIGLYVQKVRESHAQTLGRGYGWPIGIRPVLKKWFPYNLFYTRHFIGTWAWVRCHIYGICSLWRVAFRLSFCLSIIVPIDGAHKFAARKNQRTILISHDYRVCVSIKDLARPRHPFGTDDDLISWLRYRSESTPPYSSTDLSNSVSIFSCGYLKFHASVSGICFLNLFSSAICSIKSPLFRPNWCKFEAHGPKT